MSLKEERASDWTEQTWVEKETKQSEVHDLFPIVPKCSLPNRQNCSHQDIKASAKEKLLELCWMKAIQSDQLPSEHSNFIESGGTSFKAVFFVSQLQRLLHIDVSVSDLLLNPLYGKFRDIILEMESTVKVKTKQSPISETNVYPLTVAQHRMLAMQQTAPYSTAYIETVVITTKFTENIQHILTKLVKQHPSLASRIDTQGCKMTLSNALDIDPPVERIEDFETVQMYITDSIPVMVMLGHPLVKFRHVATKGLSHIVIHIHHIIADDVTISNIKDSLCQIIGQSKTQGSIEESESFSSFALAEQDYFSSVRYQRDEKFWKDIYSTLPCDTQLSLHPYAGTTFNDTTVFEARHINMTLPLGIARKINTCCKEMEMTCFQYYLSCVLVVLHRYSGSDDIAVAIPVTTRSDVYKQTDGMCINTLIFRSDINYEETLKAFLKYTAKNWLNALGSSHYPLGNLVNQLWKMHGKSINSFCSVMFNYLENKLSNSQLRINSKHAKVPLHIDIVYDQSNEAVQLNVKYASDLIDKGIVSSLSESLKEMIGKPLYNANIKLNELEFLPEAETNKLETFETNQKEISEIAMHTEPVFSAFNKHVRSHPYDIALFCEGREITFRSLSTMASKIAKYLRTLVCQKMLKEKPIVVAMKKSEFVVATIIGIWKVGGYFLPVATFNILSLRDTVQNSGAVIVMTNEAKRIDILDIPNLTLVSVDELVKDELSTFDESDEDVIEADTAYVIKTSGSTGKPKQCYVSHKSLSVMANAWTKTYKLDEFPVSVLQWAPISFDVFIGDLVRGLICSPGKLCLCPDDLRLDIKYIRHLIKTQHITVAEVTPQFGWQLVDRAEKSDLASLNILILGSDILQLQVYRNIKMCLRDDQRLINSYGMTEATIDSACFEGNVIPETRGGTVPIGKPLPGIRMFILDPKSLKRSPIGTAGELYISGPVIASGDVDVRYIDTKYIALKTGDGACWLPTGDIELFGRLDDIVKLRGFRISTSEIENLILENSSQIKDIFVTTVAINAEEGVEFLCAYAVLKNVETSKDVSVSSVRQCLLGKVPYYMMPDILYVVDRISLTVNGKVDRNALPKPEHLMKNYVSTRSSSIDGLSPTSLTLLKLFAEALGIQHQEDILLDVSFMEQGGNSLILVRFSSLLQQKTPYKVGIADIFSYPTISSLTEFIDNKKFSA